MGASVFGREAELSVLGRVLEEDGPRVCFVYGISGIGKSTLLDRFADDCRSRGVPVFRVDCRSVEPTDQGFLEGLAAAVERSGAPRGAGELVPIVGPGRSVVIVDTYELFRIADPWLRRELLAALGPSVSVVVAGREPPMLEWTMERGQFGGLEVLPLGPLDDHSVDMIIRAAGVDEATAAQVNRIARGHPLALRLALEACLYGVELPDADARPRVIAALAGSFRDGLDERARRVLDAAAVPRRITRGVLEAMLGEGADAALDLLSKLALIEATAEGFRLHDAVHVAIVERLRAVDPDRFRQYRTAAWHHLESQTRSSGRHELAGSTADLLFLIDNPVVREAMFPTTAHLYSVEASRPDDAEDLRALWHHHEPPEAANVLDRWLQLAPGAVRVVRDRTGSVVGCSIVSEWRDIPHSMARDDPVTAAWAKHAATHPLPAGQRTLVQRRVLARDGGEGPSGPQAAAWLDLKRDYFRMRPHLGRVYAGLANPQPFLAAMLALGFEPFDEPVVIGGTTFHLAMLEFGPQSIDGWLARLAAAELGITEQKFLDHDDRTADIAGQRIQLSPLEFGVLETLADRSGRPVTRAELIEQVWGTTYAGGSNVVDVVIRTLRQKLGPDAARVETVRGVGYRLR